MACLAYFHPWLGNVVSKRIAVIGAGWAGCAAAMELTARGEQVTIFEAARTVGGRARAVPCNGLMIDNGQHILLGAYVESLRLMKEAGIDLSAALLRLPMQMRYPHQTGISFVAGALPAPLHVISGLLGASGLTCADRWAMMSFAAQAKKMHWTAAPGRTVAVLLHQLKQTDRLIQLMWRPLCLAALNTPPEQACAQVFLNVLKDSLGANRAASEMLLPRVDLSSLFPQKAIDYVLARGGAVIVGKRVESLIRRDSQWHLKTPANSDDTSSFDQVVVATDPRNAMQLLSPLAAGKLMSPMTYQPITTCYLQYSADCCLDAVFYALVDDPRRKRWGQFVFDRGLLNPNHKGLLAIVISASDAAAALAQDDLVNALCRQLAEVFSRSEFLQPIWARVISEKRATFSCVPGMQRPENNTSFKDLALAGDFTAGPYPATLEGAVRSGIAAAAILRGS